MKWMLFCGVLLAGCGPSPSPPPDAGGVGRSSETVPQGDQQRAVSIEELRDRIGEVDHLELLSQAADLGPEGANFIFDELNRRYDYNSAGMALAGRPENWPICIDRSGSDDMEVRALAGACLANAAPWMDSDTRDKASRAVVSAIPTATGELHLFLPNYLMSLPEAARYLIELLDEPGISREMALRTLVKLPSQASCGRLDSSLSSADPSDRALAATVARAASCKQLLQPLQGLLKDPDAAVRGAALRAVVALDPDRAEQVVRTFLRDPDEEVRRTAWVLWAEAGQ
jgi:hypothetical protein